MHSGARVSRAFVGALVLATGTAAASDCTGQVALSDATHATQGKLMIGHAPPGTEFALGERRHRVGADGVLVFGLAHDAPPTMGLRLTCPDGSSGNIDLDVIQRQYPIERIEGVPEATVNPPPQIAERIAREQGEVAKVRERDDERADFLATFDWPVAARVSGVYGSQRVLNGTPKDPHYGLDLAAPEGTAVHAPAPGIVTLAEPDFYLTGGTVLLDHGHGVSSVFIHLSRIDVKPGQRLPRGAVLGAVGKTGRATGPHLHWGLNWFDQRLDPGFLLERPYPAPHSGAK
jgi:murein DD-endopeptidase MepM/ murein hydrolase activator NlpD